MASFFEQQHASRRKTRVMLVLYALAVAGVVLAVDAAIATAWLWGAAGAPDAGRSPGAVVLYRSVPGWLYLWATLATLAVILGASFVQMMRLREGGAAVAAMIGARRIDPGTNDRLERRLLNVVEEMAIAAGVRVPGVFVMDGESGINAFAAGYEVSNSVVAVTRGTLETLTRDELQGVIGHEFSHIVNGDMSLNIRMMGILAGIVFIGSIGGFILRNVRGSKKSGAAVMFIGLALFIIGYVGLFFARLIKASVSREREFLADASSVQFTRNPDGIAGALDQIRASGRGAIMESRYAEEVSHMFFGQGVSLWLGGLFDTHPPIDERIRRVNPRFAPSGYRSRRQAAEDGAAEKLPAAAAGFAAAAAAPAADTGAPPNSTGARAADLSVAWGRSAGESAALVGSMDAGKVDYAQRLLAELPSGLRERLHEPDGAGAAVLALLLSPDPGMMEQQLAAARAVAAGGIVEAARALAPQMRGLGLAYRLPVVDLALPALKAAQVSAQEDLVGALQAVIHADRRVSLHEFVVLTLVRAQLAPRHRYAAPKFKFLAEVRAEAILLLSLVAWAGCRRPGAQGEFEAAFRAGAAQFGWQDASPMGLDALTLDHAGAALEKLRDLAPLPKAVLVKAMFAAITADGSIRVAEAELMRMAGAVLDCPLPPLLENLDPGAIAG